MLFKDNYHKIFYEENVKKTNSERDPYRKALFYTLGLTEETRKHVNHLYDFRESGIDFDGLSQPWQTSTSKQVTRLAFNLYNNFCGDIGDEIIDNPSHYTPEDIFSNSLMAYMFEAVKVRYPEYYHEVANKHDIYHETDYDDEDEWER